MEQTVTLAKVQEAMKQLREAGERVSRRNVRAITGGGMSTVHRLMSEIQEAEFLQASLVDSGISPSLQKAVFEEIQGQTQKATTALYTQIAQLKEREDEALASLTQVEESISYLELGLKEAEDQVQQEREAHQRTEATFQARLLICEQSKQEKQAEIDFLRSALESVKLEKERGAVQIEQLEKALIQSGCREEQLAGELASANLRQADLEKRAAVNRQQMQDQRRQLAKMEKRVENMLNLDAT